MTIVICKKINPQASIKVDEDTLQEIRLLYGEEILRSINELIGENAETNENQDHQTKHSGYSKTLNVVVDTHPKRVASSKELLTQRRNESSTECIVIDHHINDYPHPDQDTSNNVCYVGSAPSNSVLMYKLWEKIKRSQETGTDEDEFMLRLATLGLVGDNASKGVEEIKTLINDHIPYAVSDDEIVSLLNTLNPKLPNIFDNQIIMEQHNIQVEQKTETVQIIYISVQESDEINKQVSDQDQLTLSVIKLGKVLKSEIERKMQKDGARRNSSSATVLILYSEKVAVVKIISNSGDTNWCNWLKTQTGGRSGGHGNNAAWTVVNPQMDESWKLFIQNLNPNNTINTYVILDWFNKTIIESREAICSFLRISK